MHKVRIIGPLDARSPLASRLGSMANLAEINQELARAERSAERTKASNKELQARLVDAGVIVGSNALAAGSTMLTGFVEQRVRTKDGAPLSLGPVSLPTAIGVLSSTTAAALSVGGFKVASGLTNGVACGHIGMASGTVGRGIGTKRYLAKSGSKADKPKAGELAGDASDDELMAMLEAASR